MGGVDLDGGAVVLNLGVTRDGDKRDLLVARVDTRQDDRVGAVGGVAGAAVGAQQQHVERVFGHVGVGQGGEQVARDDLAVVELRDHVAEPQAKGGAAHGKHAYQRAQDGTADGAATATLARALGVAAHVLAAVDTRTGAGGGNPHLLFVFLLHVRCTCLVVDGIGNGHALDVCPHVYELFDEVLVPAVDMMNGRDLGGTVGDKAGDHQRGAAAEVG